MSVLSEHHNVFAQSLTKHSHGSFSVGSGEELAAATEAPAAPAQPQATVIPGADSLIGDLLDMDLSGGPTFQPQQPQQAYQPPAASGGGMDLLGEGLDGLVGGVSRDTVCW